ncbi:hypothetical protein ACRAWF_10420 [Streptomyces sp. L7]
MSAVIGITQSRKESVDAINELGGGMPVIGASVTGDFMADEARNFFHTQPTNERMAEIMAQRAMDAGSQKSAGRLRPEGPLQPGAAGRRPRRAARSRPHRCRAPVVRSGSGPHTRQRQHHRSGAARPRRQDLRTAQGPPARSSTSPGAPSFRRCSQRFRTPVGETERPKPSPIPIISSDVNTLIEFKPVPQWAELYNYPAVNLYYVSFSDKPVLHSPAGGSDYSTGSDSFRAAAAVHQAGIRPVRRIRLAVERSCKLSTPTSPSRTASRRTGRSPCRSARPGGASRPIFLCLAPHSPRADSHAHCDAGGH